MLSQTLANLARDGSVERREVGDRHHVEYDLTPAGRCLAEAMATVVTVLYEVMPQVMAARVDSSPLNRPVQGPT